MRIVGGGGEKLQAEGCEEKGKENKTSRNVMIHGHIPHKNVYKSTHSII